MLKSLWKEYGAKPIIVSVYVVGLIVAIKKRIQTMLVQESGLIRKLTSGSIVLMLTHHLVKILSFIREYFRFVIAWRKVPGEYAYVDGRDFIENSNRLNHWRLDRLSKHRDAPLVKAMAGEIVLNTPEAVEWMLKNEFLLNTKPDPAQDVGFRLFSRFIGKDGIFMLRHGKAKHLKGEHEMWYKQRKQASLIFTKNNFANLMRETFTEKADRLIGVLGKTADKNEKVDMQCKFFSFTMDSIQKIFFGREVSTIENGELDDFAFAFDEAQRAMLLEIFGALPTYLLAKLVLPFPFGSLGNDPETSLVFNIYEKYFAKNLPNFNKQVNELHAFSIKVIKEARADPNLSNRRDLLANFLNSNEQYSDETLKDVVLNMTIAGRDTTACTLTWMLYILTQDPDVQEKLCQEIDEKLKGRSPTIADLDPKNMPYLNGFLFETLRLYPPVPEDQKEIAEDGVKYLDGTPLLKGTQCVFVPYTMGRNPDFYPDPLKVDPERWIPFKQPNPYKFPVFQAGPRFCLGKDMAQMEAKLVMAKLLQNFTFTLLEGEAEKITYSLMVTLSLCNSKTQDSSNLWVFPKRRNPRSKGTAAS